MADNTTPNSYSEYSSKKQGSVPKNPFVDFLDNAGVSVSKAVMPWLWTARPQATDINATQQAQGALAAEKAGGLNYATLPKVTTPEDINESINGGGGGNAGSATGGIYSPLFAAINQQKKLVNSRYTANLGNITNLYGQITAARQQDINSTNALFTGLRSSAANRTQDINAEIGARENARMQEQQALLRSLGIEDQAVVLDDMAARQAANQQNLATATGANWEGFLAASQANAQGALQTDKNLGRLQRAQDIQNLRLNREGALGQLFQQEQQVRSQKAQAEVAIQQAQAAAASSLQQAIVNAESQVERARIAAQADQFKAQGPIMGGIASAVQAGAIGAEEGPIISQVIADALGKNKPSDFGSTKWTPGVLLQAIMSDPAYAGPEGQLNPAQQQVLMGIVGNMTL